MYDSNKGDALTFEGSSTKSAQSFFMLIDTSDSSLFNARVWRGVETGAVKSDGTKVRDGLLDKVKTATVENSFVQFTHIDDDHIEWASKDGSTSPYTEIIPNGSPTLSKSLNPKQKDVDPNIPFISNVLFNSPAQIMNSAPMKVVLKPNSKDVYDVVTEGDSVTGKYMTTLLEKFSCDCAKNPDLIGTKYTYPTCSVTADLMVDHSTARRSPVLDYNFANMRTEDFTKKGMIFPYFLDSNAAIGMEKGNLDFIGIASSQAIWPSAHAFYCFIIPNIFFFRDVPKYSDGRYNKIAEKPSNFVNLASTSTILKPTCYNDDGTKAGAAPQELSGLTTGDIDTQDLLKAPYDGNNLKRALTGHYDPNKRFLFFKVPHHGSAVTNSWDQMKEMKIKAHFYFINGGETGGTHGNPSEAFLQWIVGVEREERSDPAASGAGSASSSTTQSPPVSNFKKYDTKCEFNIKTNGARVSESEKFYIVLSKAELGRKDSGEFRNVLIEYLYPDSDIYSAGTESTCENCWTPACRRYGLLFLDEAVDNPHASLTFEPGTGTATLKGPGLLGIDCNYAPGQPCKYVGSATEKYLAEKDDALHSQLKGFETAREARFGAVYKELLNDYKDNNGGARYSRNIQKKERLIANQLIISGEMQSASPTYRNVFDDSGKKFYTQAPDVTRANAFKTDTIFQDHQYKAQVKFVAPKEIEQYMFTREQFHKQADKMDFSSKSAAADD